MLGCLSMRLGLCSTRTGDEGHAVHGAGGVPQCVEDAVRWDQRLSLTHDHTAHCLQDGPHLERESERESESESERERVRERERERET